MPGAVRLAAEGAGRGRGAQPAGAARRHRQRGRRPRRLRFITPAVSLRTGDTPAAERARFQRAPADILITTPESLFLLLTSNARDRLRSVETVIIDEIHALVSTKRGAHLALSLERLEQLEQKPLQRIGLSATQRTLDEIARFLGGAAPQEPERAAARARTKGRATPDLERELHEEFAGAEPRVAYRPVTLIDAREPKKLTITVEVPIDDMAKVGTPVEQPSGPAAQAPPVQTIWSSIHPRLLELIRAHRSTLLFVNSRRLAERLAGALNELAGEALVRAHHGSLARAQRTEIEDLLKAGPAARAGRHLVARARHRHGRHRSGRPDRGAAVGGERPAAHRPRRPSHRRDQRRHHLPEVPRRPAGVRGGDRRDGQGAGRTVALPAQSARRPRAADRRHGRRWTAGRSTSCSRWSAAPRRSPISAGGVFDGVLDMLSGRYPSDEFAELRPRVTWDRVNGTVTARQGAKRVAIANAGTIPDRGLYGVFLAGAEKDVARVGELDEEMVFEARAGETFLLGASTWRIEQITHDRVLVSPAPGRARQDAVLEGRRARAARSNSAWPSASWCATLRGGHAGGRRRARSQQDHGLDVLAAENLMQYLDDQAAAVDAVPDDRTIADRALPRRARRLARLGAVAVRQPRARAVGDGGDRAHPRRDAASTSR